MYRRLGFIVLGFCLASISLFAGSARAATYPYIYIKPQGGHVNGMPHEWCTSMVYGNSVGARCKGSNPKGNTIVVDLPRDRYPGLCYVDYDFINGEPWLRGVRSAYSTYRCQARLVGDTIEVY